MVTLMVACGGETPEPNPDPQTPTDPQPMPTEGQSDFVSADGQNGEASQENTDDFSRNNANAPEAGADAESDSNRTVEEGDIYRVASGSGLILNLNSYRGLQIIDFSDVGEPEILGNVQVSGTPVEMYQVGDRVYMLLNNWRGYWGSRADINVNTFEGGLVLAVDVSDPSNPEITGQAQVPGYIRKSRLTRGDGKEALFVVASEYGSDKTYVKSFKVSNTGTLAEKSEIDLGGYVTDIQASNELLMVARWDWSRNGQGSDVTVIDITDPDGAMTEGDTITVEGQVAKKTNMDHTGDVLRVVSGNNWSNNTNTNHLQTFDVSDIDNITPLDSATFGDGENLFATIFLEEKAFFVTYLQVDPFHAFSIDAAGQVEEKSEFIVSGWNNWFKPVEQNRRLVGIGYNDEGGGRTLSVSLYDIEDLTNPDPLVDREDMDLSWGWSEANWDDRAFSVLEKGTNVTAPTGELETGLVLLPFSGWNDTTDKYESGVQIFTFSDSTLTKRGIMYQDTQVRRSFVADRTDNTTGNLSEAELSLFDTTDPDQPSELSRLELAPNYTAFLTYGAHGVRRHDNHYYWGWWGGRSNVQQTDTLQVVSLSDDVDRADSVADIEVPSNAQIYKVGDLLVAVTTEYLGSNSGNQPDTETELEVWDLSDPTQPQHVGSKVTQDLPPQYGYYNHYNPGGFGGDVAVAGYGRYYYGGASTVQIVDDALVFVETNGQQRLEGTETITTQRPSYDQYRWQRCYDQQTNEPQACTFLAGHVSCRQLTRTDGTVEDEVCTGSFQECTQDDQGETDCVETTPSASKLETNSWTRERHRYWVSYDFHTVDLTDPTAPTLGTPVQGDTDDEAAGLIAKGDQLYFAYKRPHTLPGDSRPYVKYYFKTLNLSDPSTPVIGGEINVPGELLEVEGDQVVTRDFLWGQNIIETSVNKLQIKNGRAYLKGAERFTDRQVHNVQLDGAGNIFVSHQTSWLSNYSQHGYHDYDDWDRTVTLAILDMTSPTFELLSETEIDDWASLTGALPGKALFTVPGGMLVINVADTANPHAQAYFPLRGWPRDFETKGDEVYFAAGPYGLYTFDTDEYNLTAAP